MNLTKQHKIECASNPTLSFEEAVILSIEEDIEILRALARNTRTPVYLIIQLANHDDWYLRSCVAGNTNAPLSVLERLASDKEKYVRCYVAGNPNTPLATLEHLVDDKDNYTSKMASESVRSKARAVKHNTRARLIL